MDNTITSLIADRIRVSIIGMSAQVAICAEICSRTNSGDTSLYSICKHEAHFRELLLASTTPPITRTAEQDKPSLLMMGFPSCTIASADQISLCACHHRPSREGYSCTRCDAKVCRLPSECPMCGLTLILSTHLARSYHHLFPLKVWSEVSWADAAKSVACYSCLTPFPTVATAPKLKAKAGELLKGVSESGRYACSVCRNHFCIDCDVYAHEYTHYCPGCSSEPRAVEGTNGNSGAMEIDS